MTTLTIAQAQRDIDRVKLYLNTLDERYDAIDVACPRVTVGKGLSALQASIPELAQFSVPTELEELPAEGKERLSKATDAIKQVEALVATIRSCADHIKNGTPLTDNSGLAMCARIVRTGYLNGEAVEATSTLKYLEENLQLAERKLEAMKDKKFRIANACEVANLKNRLRYLTSLLQLSRQTPSSVLDQRTVETAIALGNKELDELLARLNSFYSRNPPQ
ncbi:hypothetical protein QTH91_05870 [Variovorax dokdonensis]|uniref:Uncharacterized protein n=1 Tax=Variovorax dokdonensis TaxID=344883 RepID=A0ABT7N7V9_9BURK|nr:hypothetical protein [Variovorax dokdonensis]MDM0044001.1 hypothetical protein [Variovorax dokdonensis]